MYKEAESDGSKKGKELEEYQYNGKYRKCRVQGALCRVMPCGIDTLHLGPAWPDLVVLTAPAVYHSKKL